MKVDAWLVTSTPWVGSPIMLNLVVVAESNDEAIKIFRNFYKKDDLEITGITQVMVYDGKDEKPS